MTHHRKTLTIALGFGIALAAVLGTAAPAHAQYAPGYYPPPPPPPPPPRGVYRSGFIFGGSLGLGLIHYSDCGSLCGFAISGELHVGGMIGPRLALMGDFWGSSHFFSDDGSQTGNGGSTTNGIYTLALQYWPADNLWLKGGIGFGHITVDTDDYTLDDSGFAFMLAAGIELVQAYNYAMDLQVRYGNASYTDSNANGAGDTSTFTVMIGFNWY